MEIRLTEEERKIISQALWDLNVPPEDFVGIIRGSIVRKWPERGFCVARLLESVNWFDVVKIFSPEEICEAWKSAEKYARNESIQKGMEFACRTLR